MTADPPMTDFSSTFVRLIRARAWQEGHTAHGDASNPYEDRGSE